MSSREPMWYCHECRAEMRPLMAPDPICASCHGSFVEKIDDPSNDPREFAAVGGGPAEPGDEDGMDNFFVALQTLLNGGLEHPPRQRSTTQPSSQRPRTGSTVTFQISSSGGNGQRSFTWGTASPPRGSPNPNAAPTMSEFVRPIPSSSNDRNEGDAPPQISGPLFTHYLLSLLGQTDHPMLPLFMNGMPEDGRMGDYVFSQEALDQIITQIMESSNAHRPVPATEEVTQKLPRDVLVQGSPLLSKDCAVCKDQFQLGTEDPDEQIIITLPCQHPFHQTCILPWLKSSGTCPVCRHALVPQPSENPTPNNTNTTPSSPSSSTPRTFTFGTSGNPFNFSSSRTSSNSSSNHPPRARSQSPIGHRSSRSGGGGSGDYRGGSGTGIFTQLFGNLTGLAHHGNGSGTSSSTSTPMTPPRPPSPSPPRRPSYRTSMEGGTPFPPMPRPSSHPHSHSRSNSNSHTRTHTFGGAFGFGSSHRERDQQRQQYQQNQNQSSDDRNNNSSRRRGSGEQNSRPHVPGQWMDDSTDLD